VVEVVVRIDEILDRLVGEELVDFGDHGIGALIVQRTLDHRDVVLELDGDGRSSRAVRMAQERSPYVRSQSPRRVAQQSKQTAARHGAEQIHDGGENRDRSAGAKP